MYLEVCNEYTNLLLHSINKIMDYSFMRISIKDYQIKILLKLERSELCENILFKLYNDNMKK